MNRQDDALRCMKEAGVSFVARFYDESRGTSSKCLTRAEAQAILATGLQLFTVFETGDNERSYFSRSRGTLDAQAALAAAGSAGQPRDQPIFFAVDFDATDKDLADVISAYFSGVQGVLRGLRPIGVYGSYAVCRYARANWRNVPHLWQTAAWSHGERLANIDLFQTAEPPGVTCGVDVSRLESFVPGWKAMAPGPEGAARDVRPPRKKKAEPRRAEVPINLDAVDAQDAPDAQRALGQYGIQVTDLTPGTRLEVVAAGALYESAAVPRDAGNLLLQSGREQIPVSYTLRFSTPLEGVRFTRPTLLVGPNGTIHPDWTAAAMNADGKILASLTGERIASFTEVPEKTYQLNAPGMVAMQVAGDNKGSEPNPAAFLNVLIGRIVLLGAQGATGAEAIATPLPAPEVPLESVPTLRDRPARVDQLGRSVFAEVLARKLRWDRNNAADDPGTFLLHIGGPWGSGKSSVLNFLAGHLKKDAGEQGRQAARSASTQLGDSPWVVVTFNAWQHQRTGPPWWSLLDLIYVRSLGQISLLRRVYVWLREHWWRIRTLGTPVVVRLIVIAVGVVLLWVTGGLEWIIGTLIGFGPKAKDLKDSIGAATAVIGLAAAIVGFSRRGASQAAASYVNSAEDPLTTISHHFQALTRWIGSPIAVMIDDLDRCRSSYVVELLEGIQTLFADGSAAFVVAADRHWLRTCYETEYAGFRDASPEPGRPLGYFFLDKIFQLSADVPLLGDVERGSFMKGLLGLEGAASATAFASERNRARDVVRSLPTEAAVLAEVNRVQGQASLQAIALRQEATLRLAAPTLQRRTEHILSACFPLLEANPRAMKRFVNRFDVERSIRLLEGRRVGKELQLWTIVVLRWPLLAECLEARPDLTDLKVADIPIAGMMGLSADLAAVLRSEDVRRVLGGLDDGTHLDQAAVLRCVRLEPSTTGPQAPGDGD